MALPARKEEVSVDGTRDIIHEAVENAVENAKGVLLDAVVFLREHAKQDRNLYDALVADYLHTACWEALRRYAHSEKRNIWTAPNSDARQRGARVQYLAQANMNNLFSFRLPIRGLPMLGTCTREQVQEAVDFYLRQANDMRQKGMFLQLTLEMLKNNKKTVQQQLSIEDLLRAYEKAQES